MKKIYENKTNAIIVAISLILLGLSIGMIVSKDVIAKNDNPIAKISKTETLKNLPKNMSLMYTEEIDSETQSHILHQNSGIDNSENLSKWLSGTSSLYIEAGNEKSKKQVERFSTEIRYHVYNYESDNTALLAEKEFLAYMNQSGAKQWNNGHPNIYIYEFEKAKNEPYPVSMIIYVKSNGSDLMILEATGANIKGITNSFVQMTEQSLN